MHILPQSGSRDCFPACFCNALRFYGVPITVSLQKRLDIFTTGIESSTVYEVEERLEFYERSIHKFMAEWTWAQRCRADTEGIYNKPEAWARELLENGIALELRNGPIEQQSLVMAEFSRGSVVVCEVWVPRQDVHGSASRHFILILGVEADQLLMHDPLVREGWLPCTCAEAVLKTNKNGANVAIDREYFFSAKNATLKPKPNPYQTDYEDKFLLVSKH
jgi:hypothetical protein